MSYANWKVAKKRQARYLLKDIKQNKTCYGFLAPYAIIFITF